MITGESFRQARRQAEMTQMQAARALDVAQRTIGNWERGKVIPERHWETIKAVLPDADLPFPSSGSTMDENVPGTAAQQDILRRARNLKVQWMLDEQRAKTPEELRDQQHELHLGATNALDWVEVAISAGASARSVAEITRDIVQVSLEAGTIALSANRDGVDVLTDIVYRAGSLAEIARQREQRRQEADQSSNDIPNPWHRQRFNPEVLVGPHGHDEHEREDETGRSTGGGIEHLGLSGDDSTS